MLGRLLAWVKAKFGVWLDPTPVRLAVVRRYTDANGSYVGELYIEEQGKNFKGFTMIGASLDTLPFGCSQAKTDGGFVLDTEHDFLAPMPKDTVRIGALNPTDNDAVRKMVAKMPQKNMTVIFQNRFIEAVMDQLENGPLEKL